MTRDSYVKRAVSIHGDKYGYDRVPIEFKATDKIEIFCNDCKEYFTCTARNHTNSKSGCPRCGRKKANSKISSTFFHFIELASKTHGDKFDYFENDFKNMSTKTIIRCKECGNIFYQKPSMHVIGNGCPICNPFPSKMKNKEFIIRLSNEHPNLECLSDYIGDKEYITVRCKTHNHTFRTKPNWLHQGHGCPICKSSLLETFVRNKLTDLGISFTEQKRFKWLGLKSLDFFIPSLMVGIECQGVQHFKPIELFGGETAFKRCISRDIEKKMKCEENGISILYVTDNMELNDISNCHVGNIYTELNTISKHNLNDKLTEIKKHIEKLN